jgi:hypothetical protein
MMMRRVRRKGTATYRDRFSDEPSNLPSDRVLARKDMNGAGLVDIVLRIVCREARRCPKR